MDPKKWINKSHEADLSLDPDVIQRHEENMGREGYAVEAGDKLPPYGLWLYSMKSQSVGEPNIPISQNLYWHSGKILFENPIFLGESCSQKLQIRKVEKIEGTETTHLITVGHRLVSAGRTAVDVEQILLLTDQIESHEMVRRINFDPDWKQDVKPEMITSIRSMNGVFFNHPVTDLFAKTDKEQNRAVVDTSGSPALILLIESFNNNFESRVIDRITYKSLGYSFEGKLSIAGQDSDAFVTSLRIINSKNQVLYSADIRWSYSWS